MKKKCLYAFTVLAAATLRENVTIVQKYHYTVFKIFVSWRNTTEKAYLICQEAHDISCSRQI